MKRHLPLILAVVAVCLMLLVGQFTGLIAPRHRMSALLVALVIIVAAYFSARLRGEGDE